MEAGIVPMDCLPPLYTSRLGDLRFIFHDVEYYRQVNMSLKVPSTNSVYAVATVPLVAPLRTGCVELRL